MDPFYRGHRTGTLDQVPTVDHTVVLHKHAGVSPGECLVTFCGWLMPMQKQPFQRCWCTMVNSTRQTPRNGVFPSYSAVCGARCQACCQNGKYLSSPRNVSGFLSLPLLVMPNSPNDIRIRKSPELQGAFQCSLACQASRPRSSTN